MQWRNTTNRYGWIGRVLHWSSVVLVATLFIGISGLDVPPKNAHKAAIIEAHAAAGLLLLVVMATRLWWRMRNVNPARSYRIPPWQRALVLSIHRTLYVAVIAQCLLGMTAVAAGGAALPVLGVARLSFGVASHPGLREFALALHAALSNALLLLIATHATAAVCNQIFGVPDELPAAPPRSG